MENAQQRFVALVVDGTNINRRLQQLRRTEDYSLKDLPRAVDLFVGFRSRLTKLKTSAQQQAVGANGRCKPSSIIMKNKNFLRTSITT